MELIGYPLTSKTEFFYSARQRFEIPQDTALKKQAFNTTLQDL